MSVFALRHLFAGLTSVRSDSDVVYLNLFGAKHIILNSNEAISDLLEKRSAIYSDRVSSSCGPPVLLRPRNSRSS